MIANPNSPLIIFLASTGRSGSTLLELLLHGLQSCWTLGEVFVLPWELTTTSRHCGCGKPIPECPFWTPLAAKLAPILATDGEIARFRDTPDFANFLHPTQMRTLLTGADISSSPHVRRFADHNTSLFSNISARVAELTGKTPLGLVDSSKNFYRLFWLANSPTIRLQVVHLVRDPRAFVHAKTRTEPKSRNTLRTPVRMSIRYVLENALIERAARNKNPLRVRYENLASQPGPTLHRICDQLHIPFEPNAIETFRYRENHGVAGNRMRKDLNNISLDETWKDNLTGLPRLITDAITARIRQRYNYPSNS